VDDEPHFVRYYKENLEENGVEVNLIDDPETARSHVERHADDYDVIVVDLIMSYLKADDETMISDDMVKPHYNYVEKGLGMGRWVMDAVPAQCAVLVLTNRDPTKIEWLPSYDKRFSKFRIVTKEEIPAFNFYAFLLEFLEAEA
jgi:CheY-like chemotaxis protein